MADIDRHQARILAMQALCQLDAQGEGFLQRVPAFLADSRQSPRTIHYAQTIVEAAWRDRETTTAELARKAIDWTPERMTPVDRNILRTALAEFDLAQAPPKVIIDEALQIAHEYGTANSPRFLNGVLDAIWKEQRTPP